MKHVVVFSLLLSLAACGGRTSPEAGEWEQAGGRDNQGASGSPSQVPDPPTPDCGGPPLDCEGPCLTPNQLAQDLLAFCERFEQARVVRSATTCGGTRIYSTDGYLSTLYCFDTRGRLIGNSSIPVVGVTTVHGVTCMAAGEEKTVCD